MRIILVSNAPPDATLASRIPGRGRQEDSVYVCLCNAVTVKEIHAVVGLGARSFEDVRANLGVATCCGRCTDCAKATIAQALNEQCPAVAGGD